MSQTSDDPDSGNAKNFKAIPIPIAIGTIGTESPATSSFAFHGTSYTPRNTPVTLATQQLFSTIAKKFIKRFTAIIKMRPVNRNQSLAINSWLTAFQIFTHFPQKFIAPFLRHIQITPPLST